MDDPDTMVNSGCVLYKEGDYEAARTMFTEAMAIIGYQVRGVCVLVRARVHALCACVCV